MHAAPASCYSQGAIRRSGWRGIVQGGIETQAGDHAQWFAHGGKQVQCRKAAVRDDHDGPLWQPSLDHP